MYFGPKFLLFGVNLLNVGSEVWVLALAMDTEIDLQIFSQNQILGAQVALKWIIPTITQTIFLRELYFCVL